jgi:hypothetical protein
MLCKDFDCTQSITQFLPIFGGDVAQILALYKT